MSYKKQAPRYSKREARKADNPLQENIIKDSENCKSIASWATRKLAKIVEQYRGIYPDESIEKAVNELTYRGFRELGAELIAYPDLAAIVPESFRLLFINKSISAITDAETATIILIQEDSKHCLKAINLETDIPEFLRLKWEILGALLEGGIYA